MGFGETIVGLGALLALFILTYRAIGVVETIKLQALSNAKELAKLQQQEVDKLLMAPRE